MKNSLRSKKRSPHFFTSSQFRFELKRLNKENECKKIDTSYILINEDWILN